MKSNTFSIVTSLIMTVLALGCRLDSEKNNPSPDPRGTQIETLRAELGENTEFLRNGQPQPLRIMSNATARVRYALDLMQTPLEPYWLEDVLKTTAYYSQHSPIPTERLLGYFFSADASEDLVQPLKEWAYSYSHGYESIEEFTFSKTFARSKTVANQVQACQADGYDAQSCCTALLLPWAAFSEWRSADDLQKSKLLEQARTETNFWRQQIDQAYDESLKKAKMREGPNAFGQLTEKFNVFKTSDTDAWLMACSQHYSGNLNTISDFKARFGDYHSWPQTFLPASNAKRVGRRIFRHPSGNISVAETIYVGPQAVDPNSLIDTSGKEENLLNPGYEECSTRETEAIVRKDNGTLEFWAFMEDGRSAPFSVFMDRAFNRETAAPVPFTCIGCHYDRDTRLVDAVFPNIEKLGLDFSKGGAVRRIAEDCR